MPRLTTEQWAEVRAEREASGASFNELSGRFGVSHTAIIKRAKAEGWGDGQDVAEIVRRKVSEKVSGLVSTANPEKKAAALDAAAERGAEVIRQQQVDWEVHRERFDAVPADFELAKLAKITSEMLMIRHKGERLAHGLEDKPEDAKATIVIERSYGLK